MTMSKGVTRLEIQTNSSLNCFLLPSITELPGGFGRYEGIWRIGYSEQQD